MHRLAATTRGGNHAGDDDARGLKKSSRHPHTLQRIAVLILIVCVCVLGYATLRNNSSSVDHDSVDHSSDTVGGASLFSSFKDSIHGSSPWTSSAPSHYLSSSSSSTTNNNAKGSLSFEPVAHSVHRFTVVTMLMESQMPQLRRFLGSLHYWHAELRLALYAVGSFSRASMLELAGYVNVELLVVNDVDGHAFTSPAPFIDDALRRYGCVLFVTPDSVFTGPLDALAHALHRDGYVFAAADDAMVDVVEKPTTTTTSSMTTTTTSSSSVTKMTRRQRKKRRKKRNGSRRVAQCRPLVTGLVRDSAAAKNGFSTLPFELLPTPSVFDRRRNLELCRFMQRRYRIAPGKSWGSAAAGAIRVQWEAESCNDVCTLCECFCRRSFVLSVLFARKSHFRSKCNFNTLQCKTVRCSLTRTRCPIDSDVSITRSSTVLLSVMRARRLLKTTPPLATQPLVYRQRRRLIRRRRRV
jgi:hypothetical protein